MHKIFAFSVAIAVVCLLTVSLFWSSPWFLMGLLIAVSAATLLVTRKKEDVVVYAIAGVSGAVGGAIAIVYGAWAYSIPMFFGIPVWLPFLWGLAGVYLKNLSDEVRVWLKKGKGIS